MKAPTTEAAVKKRFVPKAQPQTACQPGWPAPKKANPKYYKNYKGPPKSKRIYTG